MFQLLWRLVRSIRTRIDIIWSNATPIAEWLQSSRRRSCRLSGGRAPSQPQTVAPKAIEAPQWELSRRPESQRPRPAHSGVGAALYQRPSISKARCAWPIPRSRAVTRECSWSIRTCWFAIWPAARHVSQRPARAEFRKASGRRHAAFGAAVFTVHPIGANLAQTVTDQRLTAVEMDMHDYGPGEPRIRPPAERFGGRSAFPAHRAARNVATRRLRGARPQAVSSGWRPPTPCFGWLPSGILKPS